MKYFAVIAASVAAYEDVMPISAEIEPISYEPIPINGNVTTEDGSLQVFNGNNSSEFAANGDGWFVESKTVNDESSLISQMR